VADATDTTTTAPAPHRLTAAESAARPKPTPQTPAGSAQPAAPAEASSSVDSTFLDKTDAEVNAMSPEEQAQYYAAYNKAQNAATPPAQGGAVLPPQPVMSGPPTARKGAQGDFGASTYVPPPAAQASDYVSDEHFVPQIKDPVTGEMRAATEADTVKSVDWTVTDEQTVQGQMKKLTTDLATNPVYQSLAEEMKRVNAAAGGGNSLMAESAAYDKVIGLAFNIATSDAATYAKSAEFNASMANQFGLAKNNFIYQALLSDQNYAQSQILQSNQIKGNIDSIDRQISGQLESTRIAGKAQIKSAQASASGQIASANIYADASVKNAELSARTSLQEAEMQRQTTLDSLAIDYQSKSALQIQGGEIDIAKIGATGAMQKDVNEASAVSQYQKQSSLNYQTWMGNSLIQTSADIAATGRTPGLTDAQQANATKTLVDIWKTNNDLMSSAFASSSHGVNDGSLGASLTDPRAYRGSPSSSNPYGIYGNYMSYPGFPKSAPDLPFYKDHQPGTGYPTPGSASPTPGNRFLPNLPVSG